MSQHIVSKNGQKYLLDIYLSLLVLNDKVNSPLMYIFQYISPSGNASGKKVSVLLSVSVKRFGVSLMQDFFKNKKEKADFFV